MASKLSDNESKYEFRPYSCPYPAACEWRGVLEEVVPHLLSSHKSVTILGGEDVVFHAQRITQPGNSIWVTMQPCFNKHFMLVLAKQEKDGHVKFFGFVQIIGSWQEAHGFTYKLEVNGHRRKLTWEGMPRSIRERISSTIMSSDCLVLDHSLAQLFADNETLRVKSKISIYRK